MHDNAAETHIVILAMVYLPNVGGTWAEASEPEFRSNAEAFMLLALAASRSRSSGEN